MKQRVFLLSFLLMSYVLISQNRLIRQDLNALIKEGDSLSKLKNYDKALTSYELALAIALDNKNVEKQLFLYKKTGIQNYRLGKYNIAEKMYLKGLSLDSISKVAADLNYNVFLVKRQLNEQNKALDFLEKSLELYQTLELDKSSYNAFLSAGIVYKGRQLYDKALDYLIKAYNGFLLINDETKLAYVCTTIANIQNHLKNYNQALNYHQQAFKLHKKRNNINGLGRCYSNIANVYDNLNLKDSAIVNYKKALTCLNKKEGEYATILGNLAGTYVNVDQIDLAKKSFKESITINKLLKDTTSLLYNYNGLVSLYLKKHLLKKAKHYLDSTEALRPSVSDKIGILGYYENKVEYYQKNSNYKAAFEYQLQCDSLYKEIYNIEQTEIVQSLQARFENERKENEILKLNLINKDNQLLLVEKNKNIKTKNLTLIVLATITLLLFIAYYVFRQKQKVAIQNAKIEKLQAIYEGQETIKKRIARDLHDIITTNFDGLRLRMLALKPSHSKPEQIDKITNDLKNINQQIRVVSHRLYPLEMQIGKRKFSDIIKSRLTEFQLYGKVFVELDNQFPEVINTLDLSVQNNFYGILLEVLNNIEKHAHATKLNINNYIDDKSNINFEFFDNGIGIENKAKEGIGLLNIKQRCEIINGSCHIEKIDSGTKVHIKFPIKKHIQK